MKILKRIDADSLRGFHPYYDWVRRPEGFDLVFGEGQRRSGVSRNVAGYLHRRDRFSNLFGALELVKDLEGDIAECGVWKGQSAYIISNKLKTWDPAFTGEGLHLFDSFEGLSAPVESDGLPASYRGMFATDEAVAKATLKDFPGITIHKGWIPDVFEGAPSGPYRFVHVDVDLVEPSVASIEHFFPRMVPGGVLLCDDYSCVNWPGTMKAVDEVCERVGARKMPLSTGQLLMIA